MTQTTIQNFALGISIISILLSFLSIYLSRNTRNFKKLFDKNSEPSTAFEMIDSITELLAKLKQEQMQTDKSITQINETLQTAFQHSSVIRFNSTGSDGGNLSFSLALLDGDQSGLIITSLHGREHNRIYCKGVIRGESLQQLSEEERQAFIEAMTKNSDQSVGQKSQKTKSETMKSSKF